MILVISDNRDRLLNKEFKQELSSCYIEYKGHFEFINDFSVFTNGLLIELALAYNSRWIKESFDDQNQRFRITRFVKNHKFIRTGEILLTPYVHKARHLTIN